MSSVSSTPPMLGVTPPFLYGTAVGPVRPVRIDAALPLVHDLARNLGDLLAHHDDDVRGRALNLLMRGAPKGLNSLVDPLTRIVYDKGADIAGKVIPLLERIGSERATRLLGDLADEKDSEVRIAAEAALKRIRNGEEYIEAEFENDEL